MDQKTIDPISSAVAFHDYIVAVRRLAVLVRDGQGNGEEARRLRATADQLSGCMTSAAFALALDVTHAVQTLDEWGGEIPHKLKEPYKQMLAGSRGA